nr:hypothetical protein [Kibdelosporangium sp. MJ126-NF4]CTQ98779.1 hypothetical protein [Kibdelosporangium sp. MJ126-NF4]
MAVAAATALASTLTSGATASSVQGAGFDLDRGNALLDVVYPPFQKAVRTLTPGGEDATLVADHILMVEVAWFDAIAPYHRSATGIYSNLGRRPRTEDTTRNKNTAVIYAAYTSLKAIFPQRTAEFRAMVSSAGLDPDDTSENTTTAPGIGTLAAKKVLQARNNDGSNRDGAWGNRNYNRHPYADYTGYKPVNTVHELRDPSRWQPNVTSQGGVFKVQQYATPFYGLVKPISYTSPAQFTVSPPVSSDHHNQAAYKRQADEILDASAHLTDRQKMTAEFFNDKIFSLGFVAGNAAFKAGRFDIEKAVHYVTTVDVAIFDVTVATWYFKRKYDAVRPFTAIRHLYGDKKVTAWGGPGKGTVNDITGSEWRSYPNTHDHSEYPSGTSANCAAYTQAARRFLGTDRIDITVPRAKGTSLIEPGTTPAADIALHWDSWSDLSVECGKSRVWAGVHFRAATQNVAEYAPKIGDQVYTFVQRKLNGS